MQKKSYISDFVGLDLLRFLLSLAVILCHYYFFFYRFGPTAIDSDLPPASFGKLMGYIFKWGGLSVRIFWIISGVIFFTIYTNQIETAKVNFRQFAVLRFSRLYPLHFLTFIMIAVLQGIYYTTNHAILWYQTIDVKHFFLQLFLMGAWYPSFEHSFNVPVWSVSVEIFVYAVFYCLVKAGALKNNRLYYVFGIAILFEVFNILSPFGPCLVFFLTGCILATVLKREVNLIRLMAQCCLIALIPITSLLIFKRYNPHASQVTMDLIMDAVLIPMGSLVIVSFIWAFRSLQNKLIIGTFKTMGDMTYSTYLIHFPIQMIMMLVIKPKDTEFFNHPITLIMFIASVMFCGYLLFNFFEMPVQALLRKKLSGNKSKDRPNIQFPNTASNS